MRKYRATFTIFILSIIPIIIWFFIEPLNYRFFDLNSTTTSFGQLAGLVGITLFSINLIISGRFKIIDRFFLGIDRTYQNHSLIGAVAFSLILFHPILLVIKYLKVSLNSAALFFIPNENIANNFGIIALAIFIILMIFTFYIKIKYHHWKFSHKFMVLVFVFAIIHVFLVTSDTSRSPLLMAYIMILAITGLLCGSYRALFRKLISKDTKYLIKSVTNLNNQVLQIEAEPTAKSINFMPGQFVYVKFEDPNIGNEIHPFSISSPSNQKNLRLVIKSLGDFTGQLKNLKPNTTFSVEGPFGFFSNKNYSATKQLWIAGGIGITPFLSMAGDLKNSGNQQVDLYYCVKDQTEAVLLDELTKISATNKNFRVILWPSDTQGRITGNKIAEISDNLSDREVFLCGPHNFSQAIIEQLKLLGVSSSKIHFENFNFK